MKSIFTSIGLGSALSMLNSNSFSRYKLSDSDKWCGLSKKSPTHAHQKRLAKKRKNINNRHSKRK